MKIGIMSDTHDQVQRTRRAVALLKEQGAETFIHCGDLTTPDVVYECVGLPAYFVYGNCDYDYAGLEAAIKTIGGVCLGQGGIVTLEGRKIAITHGDSSREIAQLESESPEFRLSGHTHVMVDEWRSGIRCINPGALHRAPFWSVAILDLTTDALRVFRLDRTP